MFLKEYHKKRNFNETPEPRGHIEQNDNDLDDDNRSLRFVVQKHNAKRLHYDFRLESYDGLLKSWAVPKGLSMDPAVKRLAVHVEDHPLDYLLFEGVIPEGNYGAGSVIVWDIGNYVLKPLEHSLVEQLEKGKIVFILSGKKLRGKFSLVRTGEQNHWILIKGKDEFISSEDITVTRPESVLTKKTNQYLDQIVRSNNSKTTVTENAHENDSSSEFKPKNYRSAGDSGFHKEIDRELKKLSLPLSKIPLEVVPMLSTAVNKPFDSKDWVFEIKWDGVRCILFFERHKPRPLLELQARSGKSITHRYPEIADAIKSGVTIKSNKSAILDGEIVVLNNKFHPDFQSHQKRMNIDSGSEINLMSREIPATYYVFDILYADGRNLQKLEFLQRRKILSMVLQPNDRIKISEYFEEKGIALYDKVKGLGLEGIMAKRKKSIYFQGTRSADWLKIKNVQTQDCVVIGFTSGEGNRGNYFGSLLLAALDGTGNLKFVGHCGSGFSFEQLRFIYDKIKSLQINNCPIGYVPYTNRKPIWIKPDLVAEIKHAGFTSEKIMRAPIFLRFREDKKPRECTIEVERQIRNIVYKQDSQQKGVLYGKSGLKKISKGSKPRKELTSSYKFSNLDKIYWPATSQLPALRKGDLIDYYERVSNYILPHLKDRPLSLSRYPDGIEGKHFYHKNWDGAKPEFVEIEKVYSQSRGSLINYLMCNNKETLLWLVNLGCIEMHPWYSRAEYHVSSREPVGSVPDLSRGLDSPDFIVFDLDPYIYSGYEKNSYKQDGFAPEPEYNLIGFRAAVEVAYYLKDLFDLLKITSYIKTSGKTGLHIFVPIKNIYSFKQTRNFAEVIGKLLCNKHPDKITMQWDVAQRKGKVFFDHNQNAKGKTIASIFSARPTPTATVSVPIKWNKLKNIEPTEFTILNVLDRTRKSNFIDAWNDILQNKQDLGRILQNVKDVILS